MTQDSFLIRHRRVLILCAATVALHYTAIDWVGGRLSTQSRASPLPASLMTAQLRLALPKHVDSAPPELVQVLAAAPRKPPARPKPKLQAAEPSAAPAPAPAPAPEEGAMQASAAPSSDAGAG
jgi:hypothetical protein